MLKELQATPERTTIKALEVLFDRLFQQIYAGVEWDRSDIDRLRAAAKQGTLVLLPSHKSHIDYLILSYVFNQQNLPLPLIAAGDNLNFFPVGNIFRRGGAFFIRRSFRGDRLYAAVVDAYVRRLLRDGYPIELFLEGGRSRTGKLLAPKFGLLNMVVDAALAVPERPTLFVPVSIGYERVVEAKTYDRELQGGEKAKEDAAGLFKSRDVLRHRYGRISMQVGQVLTLDEIRAEIGVTPDQALSPAKRRALVTRLGNRVMDEINRVTAVTPGALTALVLLSHDQRGIAHDELVARAERLLAVLDQMGTRKSPALYTATGALRGESIRESLQMFADTELLEIHVPARVPGSGTARRGRAGPGAFYVVANDQRLALDTSKNVIVHFFVERALVALAVLASPEPPPDARLGPRARPRALATLQARIPLPSRSPLREHFRRNRGKDGGGPGARDVRTVACDPVRAITAGAARTGSAATRRCSRACSRDTASARARCACSRRGRSPRRSSSNARSRSAERCSWRAKSSGAKPSASPRSRTRSKRSRIRAFSFTARATISLLRSRAPPRSRTIEQTLVSYLPRRRTLSDRLLAPLDRARAAASGCISAPSPLAPGLFGAVGAPHSGVQTDGMELPASGQGLRALPAARARTISAARGWSRRSRPYPPRC